MGMMGRWPSPECVCNKHWLAALRRTGVLEFSRDRCAAARGRGVLCGALRREMPALARSPHTTHTHT
jgi:hypothetical protein